MPGLTLADKQALNKALLASGASITEMNCVRRRLSAIKGGRLTVACVPAPVASLPLSDLPVTIRLISPPLTLRPTRPPAPTLWPSCAATGSKCRRRRAAGWKAARRNAQAWGSALARYRNPFHRHTQMALEALARVVRDAGFQAHILSDAIEGEARDVAKPLAGIILQGARRGQRFTGSCVLLSGGEITVTVRSKGRAGRSVEFLLAPGVARNGEPGIAALAGDTDGVDGAEEIAGAVLTPDTLVRVRAQGMNPRERLDDNDGHGSFEALCDSAITGPTLTAVNDFRAIVIDAPTREKAGMSAACNAEAFRPNFSYGANAYRQPRLDVMCDLQFESELVYGDETELPVLKEPGLASQTNRYLWASRNGTGLRARLSATPLSGEPAMRSSFTPLLPKPAF